MKKIYIYLAICIVVLVILILFTFIFFDREKHSGALYSVIIDGQLDGYIKTDRYRTEDKITYKSAQNSPKNMTHKITHEKIVFTKKLFELQRFSRERKNQGATSEALYIRNTANAFDFLAMDLSRWGSVSGVEHPKNILVFDKLSLTTYAPMIDLYDFTRGGAQSFNVLYLTSELLPPARGRIVLKSMRDEYITIDGKKIKTEVLAVKTKAFPEIYLWVSKKDRGLVRMKSKEDALLIEKVALTEEIGIIDHLLDYPSYVSGNVLFPSGDIALSGTISVPKTEGTSAAVLLVTGNSAYDRNNAGLYADISANLAAKGFIVLRYDGRGTGSSQGNLKSVSIDDEVSDIENALKFLLHHEKTDNDRVFVMAHGLACSWLPLLDLSKFHVNGLVMLSAIRPTPLVDAESENIASQISAMLELDTGYKDTLLRFNEETLGTIGNSNKEYVFVHGKHLFAKRMNQLLGHDALARMRKLNTPLLIIHGKKDTFASASYLINIESVLSETNEKKHKVVYFRKLGHFLGNQIKKPNSAHRYEINSETMETISTWLEAQAKPNLTNP